MEILIRILNLEKLKSNKIINRSNKIYNMSNKSEPLINLQVTTINGDSDTKLIADEISSIEKIQESDKIKKIMNDLKSTNYTLMGSLALSNILYTNLNSFYPTYMDDRHPELSTLHFGVIISAFGVSNFIFSLYLGKHLSRFKRKRLIIQSFVLLFFSTFGFVFLDALQPGQYNAFFYLSILLRIF
jgi:hypothetical protein